MPSDRTQSTHDRSSAPTKTRVSTMAEVTLLMREGGTIPVAFNQGEYGGGSPDSRLAVDGAGGKPRTIQSSGCGLCSLVSYLAVARLRAPKYDRSAAKFVMEDGIGRALTPGSFNRYLLDRIQHEAKSVNHKKELIRKVYAPDGCGALLYRSALLVEWIEALIELNGEKGGIVFGERIDAYAETGKEIPKLTAHLESGDPAIVGVSFAPNAGPAHQVLVVGYGRTGNKLYYPILDSGFGPMQIEPLLQRTNPVPLSDVQKYSASLSRGKPYHKIVWVMPLSGLASLSGLTARSEWAPSAQTNSHRPLMQRAGA